jgi:hypothetical protein
MSQPVIKDTLFNTKCNTEDCVYNFKDTCKCRGIGTECPSMRITVKKEWVKPEGKFFQRVPKTNKYGIETRKSKNYE